MNQANPPPIDLEKYLAGKKHRYCTYQNGARLYSMAYWSFVVMCKKAGANISLRKTALVDLDVHGIKSCRELAYGFQKNRIILSKPSYLYLMPGIISEYGLELVLQYPVLHHH